jgi:mannose-1-phosphate guanylyltransferase
MAGGSGERFWPLSRPDRPKQLLRLTDPDQTMLEEAVNRIRPLSGDHTYISTSAALQGVITDANVVEADKVLAEPARRNTLGALVWVTASLLARDLRDSTVAVLTADHKIGEPDRFRNTVAAAMDVAESTGGLVTLGITPDRPETGYGYIEMDRAVSVKANDGRDAFRSKRFLEKPSLETATEFVESGNYLWNAGMFFFTIDGFEKALKYSNAEAHAILLEIVEGLRAHNRSAAVHAFERLPNLSIDFAVMERAELVYVTPSDFPWDDVGAWDALERSLDVDERGNVLQGRVVALDSTGCVVFNDDEEKQVGVVGLNDLIVVTTRNAVLVCPKSEAQRVKQIVANLQTKQ